MTPTEIVTGLKCLRDDTAEVELLDAAIAHIRKSLPGLTVDLQTNIIYADDIQINATPKVAEMAYILARFGTVNFSQIEQSLHGHGTDSDPKTVAYNLVYALKKLLRGTPFTIKTRYGIGYELCCDH